VYLVLEDRIKALGSGRKCGVTASDCCTLLELGDGLETGSATKRVARASGSSTASGAQAGRPRICDRGLQLWEGIGGWTEDHSKQKNS
jgi:hypothetical protein